MKENYSKEEFRIILENTLPRLGWDFSRMNTVSSPPWDYIEVVKQYLKPEDKVLDIGTGGGEHFLQLEKSFSEGVGIDIDPKMVQVATDNATDVPSVQFVTNDGGLHGLDHDFTVILNRHAPFNLATIREHLVDGGLFITQQVGNLNMLNIKEALGMQIGQSPISRAIVESSGLRTIELQEYNIPYAVKDIESLVFWLSALDMLHSDIEGTGALMSVEALNKILKGNVTSRGFVTNEQRYLVIAQNPPMTTLS